MPHKSILPALITAFTLILATHQQAWSQQLQITSATSSIQFVGSKPTGSHNGGFRNFSGQFNPGTGQLTLTIDMTSVQTDDQKLTGHLMSPDFFDARKFATASFRSTQIRKQQNGTATHVIAGDLTLHGATQPIEIPCTIRWQEKSLMTIGTVKLSRSAFGINFGAGEINDEVPVTFQLLATAAVDGEQQGSGSGRR